MPLWAERLLLWGSAATGEIITKQGHLVVKKPVCNQESSIYGSKPKMISLVCP